VHLAQDLFKLLYLHSLPASYFRDCAEETEDAEKNSYLPIQAGSRKKKKENRVGAELNSSNREKSKEQFEQWQQSHACSVTFGNKRYSSYYNILTNLIKTCIEFNRYWIFNNSQYFRSDNWLHSCTLWLLDPQNECSQT
jgi:hypothetical protein